MTLFEALRLATESLSSRLIRTLLTVLGIAIAVHSLVVTVSVVQGLNHFVGERLANFGPGVFVVSRFGLITSAREWIERQKRPLLTIDDFEALRRGLTMAKDVGAASLKEGKVKAGKEHLNGATIRGVTPNMVDIKTEPVAAGRYIASHDMDHRSPVCFIGYDIAMGLFNDPRPLGRTLVVDGMELVVVGVAAPMGSFFGDPQDDFVYMPLTTYMKLNGRFNSSLSIYVQSHSPGQVERATDEARLVMRARHHLAYEKPDDFGLLDSGSILGLWTRLTEAIRFVSGVVSVVFLLVGGVVVMNIMLASVTERTREIGIRKSLGARRRDVMLQFLVEAVALTASGGMAGILLAVAVLHLLSRFLPDEVSLSLGAAVVAMVSSSAVGLFFGLYPARRAAMLDPIQALRWE